MKRNHIILTLVVGSVLLFQLGCQEQAAQVEKPTPAASLLRSKTAGAPEPAVVGTPQKAEAAPAGLDTAAPKITFENIVYDFGKIGLGAGKKVAEFKFTNTGEGLLKIEKVEKCCGVVTKLDKTEYAPGESGVLKAEYQGSRPGLDRKILYVKSNDETKARFALTLKAEIVSKITCAPKRLKLFLGEDNAGCSKIVLSSLDNQPFTVTGFKSTADCITADVDSSVEATKFIFEPKVDMEKLKDNLKGHVDISLTHLEEKTVEILFDVLPKFTINPPLIISFNVEPQKPIVRKVWVLNNYGGNFEIESATSKDNTVKVLSTEKIRNGYQLELEITPPPAGDNTRFSDMFVVKIKDGDELGIVCRGFYAKK
ncbi:MAG TPA: DUF1573 domain-containing protein [Sedimentisphaerales bacterium]|nr:DUF1573 domain-containing protein [Sedimentisphaerales bacterium]